jgi:Zn-dependent protease
VGAAIAWAVFGTWSSTPAGAGREVLYWTYQFGALYCYINLILLFFNIIPLPPLDGATIVTAFLNERGMRTFYKVKQYSMFILLMLLIVVPMVLGWSPLNWYFQHTAGALFNLLMP